MFWQSRFISVQPVSVAPSHMIVYVLPLISSMGNQLVVTYNNRIRGIHLSVNIRKEKNEDDEPE